MNYIEIRNHKDILNKYNNTFEAPHQISAGNSGINFTLLSGVEQSFILISFGMDISY